LIGEESIILQTGGLALGEISIKSKPSSFAIDIEHCRTNYD